MRDYAPPWGGTAKPILAFADGATFMAMGWYEEKGPSGWNTAPIRGFRIFNLDVVGSKGTVRGVYLWGKVENLEVCGSNFRDGFGNAYVGVTTMTVRYVNFHHNRITNNPFGIGQIVGTSCLQDCWFDSNYMDLSGGPKNRDHSIYVGSSPYGGPNWPEAIVGPNPQICQGTSRGIPACFAVAKGTRIVNNEIRRSAWGVGGTRCNASAIVVHSPHDGLVIENNLIFEPVQGAPGCYGIDQTAGIDMPGAWNRTVIRRNQIFNVGGNGITVGNCKDCIVENNVVYGGTQGIQYPDPGNRCRSAPHAAAMAEYTCSGNLPDSGGIVRNNTVFNGGPVTVNMIAGAGGGWVAVNNAVCGPGAAMKAGSGTALAGNLTATSCPKWFTKPSGDPATANFTPSETSPLVGAGSSASVGASFIGTQPWSATDGGVPPDSPPTIGAVRR
jgi:parallel beta-helix repeat protein